MSEVNKKFGNQMPGPEAGTKWRSKNPVETRHVIDRTLGGHVCYLSGRWSYWRATRGNHLRCTLDEWLAWQAGAVQLEE
jgi:hypothetical protein